MDANELGGRLADRFDDRLRWVARSAKRLYVQVPPSLLHEAVAWLQSGVPGLRLATSTGIDLRDGVGVFHHFAVNGAPLVVTLKVTAEKPEPIVPTLARDIPGAEWIEREIAEFLGVEFLDHPDPRRLLKARCLPDDVHPLRRDFDVQRHEESIGELPEQ